MFRFAMQAIQPLELHDAIGYVEHVERTRGVGLLIPGDLHLWGGGNRSDLFAYLLKVLPYRKIAILGDMFDGGLHKRETNTDKEVITQLRTLDDDARLHLLRGNHDRFLFRSLSNSQTYGHAVGADVVKPDLHWVSRSRLHEDVLYAKVDRTEYVPTVQKMSSEEMPHFGTNDALVLQVGEGAVYMEHGDTYDTMIQGVHNNPILEHLSMHAYDASLRMEQLHYSIENVFRVFKQQVSMWRGVCDAVADGAYDATLRLHMQVTGTISGHTHYPLFTSVSGLPHANVGSFRGLRPSFVVVAGDTGEILPPVVVRL